MSALSPVAQSIAVALPVRRIGWEQASALVNSRSQSASSAGVVGLSAVATGPEPGEGSGAMAAAGPLVVVTNGF